MKQIRLIALSAGMIWLIACIPSVNPFYTDRDLCFDPRLVGRWEAKGDTDMPENWVFESVADRAYKLTVTQSEGKSGSFNAHLFRLEDEHFLDIVPADCQFAPDQAELIGLAMFPGHLLIRVPQLEPELGLAFVDFNWLQKFLEKNPKALAHHNEQGRIVLTATTRNLQRFVREHCADGELFQEASTLVRQSSNTLDGGQ
jgi:hypothetical protein